MKLWMILCTKSDSGSFEYVSPPFSDKGLMIETARAWRFFANDEWKWKVLTSWINDPSSALTQSLDSFLKENE